MTEMTPAEAVYFAAAALPAADRAAYLARACAGNEDLRRQVERMLAARSAVGDFLEPAPGAGGDTTRTFGGADGIVARPPADPPTATFGDSAATADHTPQPDVGTVLAGKYKLIEEIGEGGMGSVWMAQQTEPVKRAVAVKVIKAGMDSKAVLARFEAERQALAMMDHPNIARVLDAGAAPDGRPFFVMELVKGVPITQYCDDRKLTPRQRLELFVPVCLAIQHAHMKGVIHRDIKPSNVLVAMYDDRPVPKVIDFGVAKAAGQTLTDKTLMTGFGAVVGTPEYMSPEQASLNNLDIDTRSDVYSLGVLLYELLTGTTPVDRQSLGKAALLEILRIVREVEAPRPSTKLSAAATLPSVAANRGTEPAKLSKLMKGELDWVLLKALEKDRTRRYDTANGLARDIQRYLADEVVEARPPSAGYRLRKFVRRHKARIASGFVVGLALLVGVAGTIWQAAERRREREAVRLQSVQAATSTVDRAEAALIANRLTEVDAALALVDPQTLTGDDGGLVGRIESIRRDRDMVRELEEVYEEYWTVCPSSTTRDPEKAKARYPELFRRYGVPVGELSAVTAADRVKASQVAPALTDGLATWFFLAPKVEGLRPLLDRLDPDGFRVDVRAALAAENKERLGELAAKADASQHPPVFSVMLADAASDPDSYRILNAAWSRHPDSFAVALAMAVPYSGDEAIRAKERLGWSRTAVSIRPKNALAYFNLSLTLGDKDNLGKVAALRRATALAPRFVKAHSQLGYVLHDMKSHDEALASFVRAADIDPAHLPSQVGIFMVSVRREEWVKASITRRRIESLAEPEDEHDCLAFIAKVAHLGVTDHFFAGELARNLIRLRHFRELARLSEETKIRDFNFNHPKYVDETDSNLDIKRYLPACAAVQAAAGRGIDPPLVAERPRVRRLALDWLTTDLEACGLKLCEEEEKLRPAVHATMTKWLSEPMLADVRGTRIAELPMDEQEDWRRFWEAVMTLRDRTAPAVAPPPREKK